MQEKKQSSVSIVVVTIGKKNYLSECLLSLKKQSYPVEQVVVVDNSLEPKLIKKIRSVFPGARVISSSVNLFYSASLNTGIAASRGEFVLCLNDDVVLDKNFIEKSLKGFFIRDDIGMVTGKILRRDKKTLDSTGLFLSIFRTAKERGYGRLDKGQFEKEGFVFGSSGAAAFYRRKMLEEIKEGNEYFDSSLVMFYEDLDLAWRANRFGWKGYYLPKALAYHVRGGSFRPDSGLNKAWARRYLNLELHVNLIKNRHKTIAKNEKLLVFILHFIPVALYDLIAWIYVCLTCPKVIPGFFRK